MGGTVMESAPNAEVWEAAYERVDDYLSALGLSHRPARVRLCEEIVARAREASDGEMEPVPAAMTLLFERMAHWFRMVMDLEGSDDVVLVRGRLALMLAAPPPEMQLAVFAEGEPDPELVRALRQPRRLIAGGMGGKGVMHALPLDLGALPQIADSALTGLDRRPRLRLALLWGTAVVFFGTLFFLTR